MGLSALFQPSAMLAKEYVVGGDFDYYPFTFIDKSGNPSGLDIELLEAISATTGIQLSFQLSRWDNAISYVKSGKIDIVAGIIHSEERAQFLDFTTPIHAEYYSIFIRTDLPLEDLSNLYDYRPVVLDEDASIEKYLIPMGLYKNYVEAKSLPEALSIIELGLADYVLAPNLLGLKVIDKNNYENIQIKGPSILPSIYCIAVAKGNTELLSILNEGISELRRSGKLTEIQERWKVYGSDDFKYKRISSMIGIVFSITASLLFVVFTWAWALRSQVKSKTESISLKNQELRKSEEKFRIITENSSDVIWHLDASFNLTYISQADERIRGFRKEEVIGKSLFSILKPEGIEMLKEANRQRMNDLSRGIRSAPAIYELEELCKDGSWVWVEATATAFFDRDGKISGYHGVSRDISERKKAELLLKQREIELKELNSTKDKLFSIIAHDLRSPFHAILNLSELLKTNLNDLNKDESNDYLELINSSAESTLVLLDNLLAWAKSQNGTNIYHPETINLNLIISEILANSKLTAKLKNISITYNSTEDIEFCADINMLKTILRNLVSNAIKYTYPNGKVNISAIKIESSIEIRISDDGVGMSEETLSGLFQIETNATTAGTAHEKGSGLGLILCKEFVGKHGGEIWVESELGKGSQFVFTLPS